MAWPPGTPLLLVCSRFGRGTLTAFQSRAGARPALAARITPSTLWVVSSETNCWRCLAEWLRLHDPRPCQPPEDRLAHAALIIASLLRRKLPQGLGVIDLDSHHAEDHPVPRRPNCPRCGDGGTGSQEARSTPERVAAALETVSAVTGWITSTSIHRRGGLHFAHADFVSPRAPHVPAFLRQAPSRADGIGTTRAQALARSIGEAAERYSLTFQGHETALTASWRQLGLNQNLSAALHPFSRAQYESRAEWNRGVWGYPIILAPLGADELTEWSPMQSLLIPRRTVLLPTELLYFGTPPGSRPLHYVADTLGCAAGETFEEAVTAGLLELVERDAIAIWWYNRLRRPPAMPDCLGTQEARPWIEHLQRIGRPFWTLDLTTRLGIPVIAALSTSVKGRHAALGFGCHPDPARAAAKALRELCQTSHGIEAADPLTYRRNTMEHAFVRWSVQANPQREAHLAPQGSARRVMPGRWADATSVLSFCLERLAEAGFEPLALDLTRPEIGWPVARVVCPGLCHPWHRLGIPRLQGAPVEAGLLKARLSEAEFNPAPFTL